jgi:uncharacterized protein YdaU (DUF1376 family)
MNYYAFHVGDYLTRTAHLTPMEDIVYRRLIDLYYLSEKALPSEPKECARLIRLPRYVREVESVLKEFFTPEQSQWINKRCDEEIAKYQSKADSARKANQKRWASDADLKSDLISDQKRNANAIPTNNQEPITNNQEPVKTKKAAPSSEFSLPEWISNDSFEAFIEHRKKLKAPMTHLAQTRLVAELSRLREDGNEPHAVLDQSILNGWKGVFPLKQQQAGAPVGSKAARQQQDKQWLDELTGRTKRAIIDITPT